ncbi:MAG: S-layer homology domain-containing protein [Thermaerobacter sp.]|nr:S-layer homology domain-containing protein [Thermaerobacter sp.]
MHKFQAILSGMATGCIILGTMGVAGAAGSQIANETRAGFVVQVDQALGIQPVYPTTPTFLDVPATNMGYGYIEAAYQKGYIDGVTKALFAPSAQITRAEAAKVLVEAYKRGKYTPTQTASNFTDNASIPSALVGYVAEAHMLGLMKGFGNGSFGPERHLTAAQETHLIAQLKAVLAGAPSTASGLTTNDAIPTGYVAGSTTTPVTFTLIGKNGVPVSGVAVTMTAARTSGSGTWGISGAAGGAPGTSIIGWTNAAGVVNVYLTDTRAGDTGTVTASAPDNGMASVSTGVLTITPAGPSQLTFTTPPLLEAPGGVTGSVPVTMQLEDAYGNATPASSGDIAVRLTTTSSQGAFATEPASTGSVSTVIIPAGSGIVSFFYGDQTVGTPTITAAATGLTTAFQQETISSAATRDISFSRSTVSTPSVTVTAGLDNVMLNVKVVDHSGNAIPGLTYSDFEVTSSDTSAGNAGVLGPATPADVAFANGVYTVTLTDANGDNGATQTLTVAVDGTKLIQTAALTVTPGALTMYEVSPSPIAPLASLTADSSPIDIKITAVDAGGNPIPNATVYLSFTVALGSSAGATVNGNAVMSTPNAFTTNSNGVVTVQYTSGAPSSIKGPMDTLTIANAPTSPTIQTVDNYMY